jgi:hypothetical protein
MSGSSTAVGSSVAIHAGIARRSVVAFVDVFSARGGAVPADTSARRNVEDASVISALPEASTTNARPSARRMMTKG